MGRAYYWQREISHHGLNKYRVVKGQTRWEVDQKAAAILAQWDEQWRRQQEREAKNLERQHRLQNIEISATRANELTLEAEQVQAAMDTILTDTLTPEGIDFESLKDRKKFLERLPTKPQLAEAPKEPRREDQKYNPKASLFTKLSSKKMDEFNKKNDELYVKDHAEWEASVEKINTENTRLENEYKELVNERDQRKAAYYAAQEESNKAIDEFSEAFSKGDPSAIERYVSLLLGRIEYPFSCEQDIEVECSAEEKKVVVDLLLPAKDDIPTLKAVAYVKSKNEFKETFYPETYLKKKYDHVIYQIVLQILNYVFSTVDAEHVRTVVVNGKVKTIDKATGNDIEPYILSVGVERSAFEEINLNAVDPKTWFKSAKGVSAASLANIAPVAPLVRICREDSRFIEGYEVAEHLDDGVNLASMDWQDFENLIRELFEQEFNASGGEVRITQASRDGGVDAIAFDPDPIRGGKIVIQAKRYTNVVGVSAVRDLYGTVLNEGATKGILVTTSNYGNDAYAFAQGKPLTLMNGANLLFLLEKHGHKARIDLQEAKQTLKGT